MLNVLSRDGAYLCLRSSIDSIPNILIGPAVDIVHGSGARKPGLDLGFFDQGPALDDAGNKYVFHRKVEGTVSSMPKGFEETAYWVAGVGDRSNGYYGTIAGSSFDVATIMGPHGGHWSGSCTTDDIPTSGYYYWHQEHFDYVCTEHVNVTVPRLGVINLEFDQSRSWKPSESSKVTYKVTCHTVSVYHVLVDALGQFYYDIETSCDTTTDYGSGESSLHRENASTYRPNQVQCRLTFSAASGFDIAFNSRAWQSARQDVDDREKESQIWPTLCQEAVLSMNYLDCNALALIKDIADIRQTVESSVQSFKDIYDKVGSPKEFGKAVASADLSQRYGLKLTLSDSHAVGQALERLRQNLKSALEHCRKIRSARIESVSTNALGEVTADYHYLARLSLVDHAIQRILQVAYEWDLYPSLGNAWDFVPYSFVVDWFVDVGGMLETIDAHLQMGQYHLLSAVKSRKLAYSGTPKRILLSEDALMGNVEVTEYRRWVEKQFDPMPISLTIDPSKVGDHLVEGAELIIQRL